MTTLSTVNGPATGIIAFTAGSGAVTVNAGGAVTAAAGQGIFAQNAGGNLKVTTAAVTSTGNIAVVAQNLGANTHTGTINVTTNGAVSGTRGIFSFQSGVGAVAINANGNVTATAGTGITAFQTGLADNTGTTTITVAAGKTVTATGGDGILTNNSNSKGLTTIAANGNVTSTNKSGIVATTNGGALTITQAAASTISAGVDAIKVNNGAAGGAININALGTLVANNGSGVFVQSASTTADPITVTTNIVKSTGGGGTWGSQVRTTAGSGDITVNSNGTQTSATGPTTIFGAILVANSAASNRNVTVNVNADIGTPTDRSSAAQVQVNASSTSFKTAAVNINNASVFGGPGAVKVTQGAASLGDIKITGTGAGTLSATNAGAIGINASVLNAANNGNIAIDVTQNVDGVARGISATTVGAGNISVTARGNVSGSGGDGIRATSAGSGAVTVNAGGAVTATSGFGIFAEATTGNVNVTTAAVTSTGNTAVVAENVGLNTHTGTINVTTNGAVSGTEGIYLFQSGVGDATINANANVTSTAGAAITAIQNGVAGNTGTTTITTAAGKTVTATGGDGILTNIVASKGLTSIAVNGNVTSTNKSGIVATTNGGGVMITQAAASTITAAVDAIKVNANGSGAVNVNAGGTLIATNGSGVDVRSASATADPITVTTNIVKSTGAGGTWGSQVRATAGSGDITINSNGAMGSAAAPSSIFGGILATTSGTSNRNITVNVNANIGTATDRSTTTANIAQVQVGGNSTSAKTLAVNINNASVFATSVGVRVDQNAAGLGDIRISGTGSGTISANGTGSTGILARNLNAANNGNITIDVTQNVDGVAAGINASTIGGGNISAIARGNVTTTAGSGIIATNSNAAANAGTIFVGVDTGKLVSATGGNGITTNSGNSTGLTNIVVMGEVKASGAGFAGIKGTSTNGGITVQVGSTGKVDPDIGIDLATVNGALLVNNAGLVQGDVTAIKMAATGTGTGTVVNSGTITGGTNAVLGAVANTPFIITNGGTMNGAVNVTGSAVATSNFTNGGIWNSGAAASNFAGSFINSGTTNIANGGAITVTGPTTNSGIIRLMGNAAISTNLTNTGSIVAQNGIAGNNALVLTGNYTGGGQYFADYNSGTITADTLRITGTATGNTNVALNRVGVGFLPTGFLPVVTVVPGGAAGLFTSSTPFATTGFLLESFGQNPASSSQWGIVQTINPLTGDLGGVSTLANTASATLNEPASAFVTQKTNPAADETQIGLWMRGGAGNSTEDLTSIVSAGAFSNAFNSRMKLNHQVLQLGIDYGMLNMGGKGWNLHFGLTGGKLDGGAKRRGSTTNLQFDASFAGGYVFLTNGALTVDASLRKEWREFKIASSGLLAVSPQEADGDATVASILASYRIGGATGVQITPQIGYSYGDSHIDPFAIDAFTQFVPGGDKTKLGHAGVKLGYKGVSGNLLFEPFVSATALRNWSNREDASVVFAGASTTNFAVDTFAYRNAMRYAIGLQGSDRSGKISAFVVANMTDGNRVDGASVSVGARINF